MFYIITCKTKKNLLCCKFYYYLKMKKIELILTFPKKLFTCDFILRCSNLLRLGSWMIEEKKAMVYYTHKLYKSLECDNYGPFKKNFYSEKLY